MTSKFLAWVSKRVIKKTRRVYSQSMKGSVGFIKKKVVLDSFKEKTNTCKENETTAKGYLY